MTDRKTRLKELSQLEDNWDKHNAPAIIPEIIEFVDSIIDHLAIWHIFPDTNGTLMLTVVNKHKSAALSIGIDEYSYAAIDLSHGFDERHITKGKKIRTKENVIATLKELETLIKN